MTGKVCVVGSLNLDLVARCRRLPSVGETVMGDDYFEAAGGKGLNQAVAAARAGAEVTMIGALGADDAGRALRAVMDAEGIDAQGVADVEGTPTGRAMIAVADGGANSIIVVAGANALVDAAEVSLGAASLASADVVLVQHEVADDAIVEALRRGRQAGAVTVLNPAPARPLDPEVLALVDILVPNEHEYPLLGDVSTVPTLIVTLGDRGARVTDSQGTRSVAAFSVEPVDTVAAGDAFCGALAAALAQGYDLDVALERASAAGALATLAPGAVPSLPTQAQIDALVAGDGPRH
jgi:ribokinase